jgi:hypothetical protein
MVLSSLHDCTSCSEANVHEHFIWEVTSCTRTRIEEVVIVQQLDRRSAEVVATQNDMQKQSPP